MPSSKYKAQPVFAHGRRFASKAEAGRADELILLERSGEISVLLFQPVFELAPPVVLEGRKKPSLRYVGDFSYIHRGVRVVEDVKGVLTPVFRVKQHLMKHIHGIDIRIIGGGR